MKKILTPILLAAMLLLVMALPAAALEPVNDLSSDYNNAIINTVTWAKQGNDLALNEDFLKSGVVGDVGGDWLAFGISRAGIEDNCDGYLEALENYITNAYAVKGGLDRNKTSEWHHSILAILALGGDPTAFGETKDGTPINLIADGVYNPLVGKLWKQGLMGAVWGLIALDSKDYETPEGAAYDRATIIAHLLECEIQGGGFALTGDVPDTDVTAMTLTALAPYYGKDSNIKAVVDRGVAILSKLQLKDGDYATYGTPNAESTAQVLATLCTLGIDPAKDSRFIKNGKTTLDGLMKYYNSKDGGFIHSFVNDPKNPNAVSGQPNSMATDQGRYALIAYDRFLSGASTLYDFTSGETPQAGKITSLRIEGISQNILFEQKTNFQAGDSVGTLLERVLNAKNINFAKNSYGYFSEINGESNYTFNVNYDGWLYRVNGDEPAVGMFDYALTGNEVIEIYYGPMDVAYPVLEVSLQNNKPVLTITYTYTDWTTGSPVDSVLPLTDAVVTINGHSYTTDEKGQVTLTEAAGKYPITLAKTDPNHVVEGKEMPRAVRLSPIASITVPAAGSSPVKDMTDVIPGKWYYNDVAWAMEQAIMIGTDKTTFGVGETIKRCDFATVLGRHEDISDSSASNPAATIFTDVPATSYYAAHVLWANSNNIVYGTGGSSFSPTSNITRQDMAVLLTRYAKYAGIELPDGSAQTSFSDDKAIAGYAKDAVYAMKAAGIIDGVGQNCFDPKGTATREQAAKMLHQLLTL